MKTQIKTQIKTQVQSQIVYPKCIGKFGNGLMKNCFRCIWSDECVRKLIQ